MAQLTIVYWRDIPAQVIVRAGRANAKRELPERFQESIDLAAMRSGARDSEAYLADWRRDEPVACSDDLDGEADAAVARLGAEYDKERLVRLAQNGGREVAS
jgi:Virulence factor